MRSAPGFERRQLYQQFGRVSVSVHSRDSPRAEDAGKRVRLSGQLDSEEELGGNGDGERCSAPCSSRRPFLALTRSRYFVFPSTYRWHRGSCAPASRKDLSVSCRASGATERTRSQPEYAGEDSAGTRSTDRNPEESKYLAVTHLYGCGRLSRKSLEEHLRGQIETPRPLSGRFLRLQACCSAPCTDFVDRQARGKSVVFIRC